MKIYVHSIMKNRPIVQLGYVQQSNVFDLHLNLKTGSYMNVTLVMCSR